MIFEAEKSPGLFFLFQVLVFPGVLFLFVQAEQAELLLDVAAILSEPVAVTLALVQPVRLHAADYTYRHSGSLLRFFRYSTSHLPTALTGQDLHEMDIEKMSSFKKELNFEYS